MIQKYHFWLLLFPLFIFATGVYGFWHTTIDDSFIGYRYAENLAGGQGLVFNNAERSEGYSNPLWILLLAIAHKIGIPTLYASKTLGVLAGLGTLVTISLFLRSLNVSRLIIVATLLFLAVNTSFIFWSVAGMETMFYTFLLIIAVWLLSLEIEPKNKPVFLHKLNLTRWPLSALFFGLAAITRPEGIMFLFIATAIIGVWWLRRRHIDLLRWIVLGYVPVLGLFVFRYLYFGTFIPLPVIAKGAAYGKDFAAGFAYLTAWIQGNAILTVGFIIGILIFLAHAFQFIKKNRAIYRADIFLLGVMVLMIAAEFVFAITVRGDWMPFGRFILPIMPFIAVFFGVGVAYFYQKLKQFTSVTISGLVFSILFIPLLIWQASFLLPDLAYASWYAGYPIIGKFGQCLKEKGVQEVLVSFDDIGMFPYYSELPIVDAHGLIHSDIAWFNRNNYPGDTNEQRLERSKLILAYDPTYIIGVAYAKNKPIAPDFNDFKDPNAVPRYILPPEPIFEYIGAVAGMPPEADIYAYGKYYLVYRRSDVPSDSRWENCIVEANQSIGINLSNTPMINIPTRIGNPNLDEIIFLRQHILNTYKYSPQYGS